jgi:D-arabinitol dehydrogenase (NADP+)
VRAIVYSRPETFELRTLDERALGPDEVRIEVSATGFCGTDKHLHVGEFGPRYPLIPGHEIVGTVSETAADVSSGVRVGDRVVVDNSIYCGRCARCTSGQQKFCTNVVALGIQAPGGFADQVVAQASKCAVVNDLDVDVAVLAEPAACAANGVAVLAPPIGAEVLVVGAGPSSLLLSQLLLRNGAARVTIAAPSQHKLDLAASLGVSSLVRFDRGAYGDAAAQLARISPHGFDAVVDATGSAEVMQAFLPMVRDGGTFMIYGMAAERATLAIRPYEVFRRELRIVGSFAQSYAFPTAIEYLRHGLRTEGIVSHRLPLDAYARALTLDREPGFVKAAIIPG